MREYNRICTSDNIDPTSANGQTGIGASAYSAPPTTLTTVGPSTAVPSTTTASSDAQIASAIGTIFLRPCSSASRGRTRIATACGNQ